MRTQAVIVADEGRGAIWLLLKGSETSRDRQEQGNIQLHAACDCCALPDKSQGTEVVVMCACCCRCGRPSAFGPYSSTSHDTDSHTSLKM